MRPANRKHADYANLPEMWGKMSVSAIARHYKVDRPSIHYHAKKMGLPLLNPPPKHKPKRFKPKTIKAPKAPRLCLIVGCILPHEARGYCHTHYCYFKNNGMLGKKLSEIPSTALKRTDCDHKTPKCECMREGLDYATLLRNAGIKHVVSKDDM